MAGVARLIRRVCVLREQGAAAAAVRLMDTELAEAILELRARPGGNRLPEPELQALYTLEARRVADAAVLCELMLPALLGHFSSAASSAPPPASRLAGEPSVLIARPPGTGSPAIPDLLDAMLAAERTNRRPPAPSQRAVRTTTRT